MLRPLLTRCASLLMTAIGAAWLCLLGPALADDPPRRIVSFNLCADQLVVALADPEQIVGLSPHAAEPTLSAVAEQARAFRRLPWQAESTIPFNPDLILVGAFDRSVTQRMLRQLGFRVRQIDLVNDLETARRQVRELAGLLGHVERGEKLIGDIEAARRRLAEAPRPRAATALLVENGGYTVGPTSLAATLMTEAGFALPKGAPPGYGGYVPLEKLVALRPDYLVLSKPVEAPDGQGALYLAHPALRALYPPSRRIILPSRYTLCGGPALVAAFDYLTGVMTRLAAEEMRQH
jgi:iron complex transport system substrate-binding protein